MPGPGCALFLRTLGAFGKETVTEAAKIGGNALCQMEEAMKTISSGVGRISIFMPASSASSTV